MNRQKVQFLTESSSIKVETSLVDIKNKKKKKLPKKHIILSKVSKDEL